MEHCSNFYSFKVQAVKLEDIKEVPDPIAIWPFGRISQETNVGIEAVPSEASYVAYDSLFTETNIKGSAMLTNEVFQKSYIDINFPDSNTTKLLSPTQLTVSLWIRVESPLLGQSYSLLVSYKLLLELQIHKKYFLGFLYRRPK